MNEREFLELAVEEADRSPKNVTTGKPRVGAVLSFEGELLASAHRDEKQHAEFLAIEACNKKGLKVSNATIYTTLEPCTFRSETKKPCVEHILNAGISRVVVGTLDPHPFIRGRGYEILRARRVAVDFFPNDLVERIENVNGSFLSAWRNKSLSDPPPSPAERFLVGDHFYTTDFDEYSNAVSNIGHRSEIIACYIFRSEMPDTVPFFRLWHPGRKDHFYTASSKERDSAITQHGYKTEAPLGFVYERHAARTTAFHRYFHPERGDHFYTIHESERELALASGYGYESIAAHVFDRSHESLVPVYRSVQIP